MEKVRIQWIDLAKGMCMLLVVLGHFPDSTATEGGEIVSHVMSSFRMPLYFILSGLFFKTYGNIGRFSVKKIDHLLVPYVVFYTLSKLSVHLDFSAVWFLFTLFVMNILGFVLLTCIGKITQKVPLMQKKSSEETFYISFAVSIFLAYLAYNIHFEKFFGEKIIADQIGFTEAAFVSLPFFLVGYGLRNFSSFLVQHTGWSMRNVASSVACFVIVIILCYCCGWGDNSFFINDYELPFIVTYIVGILGAMGVLWLACLIVYLPVVSYIGRYSIVVLVTHFMVINLWEKVIYNLLCLQHSLFLSCALYILIILTEIPVIWFCCRYLPYIFAQKEPLREMKTYILNSRIYQWYIKRPLLNKKNADSLRPYYTQTSLCQIDKKRVVCVMNGNFEAGGLADRLRCIVSAYQVCKELDVEFRLLFTSPFILQDYLVPGKYDWMIKDNDVRFSMDTKVICCEVTEDSEYQSRKIHEYLKNEIKNARQTEIHVYGNPHFCFKENTYGILFRELFGLSPILKEKLDENIKAIDGKYCLVQFRFMALLGDLKDLGITLPPDEQLHLMEKCLEEIGTIKASLDNNMKIVVTTDSVRFINAVKSNLPDVYTVDGNIAHIDYMTDSTSSAYTKLFVEFFLMSKAEKLYRVKASKMRWSGLPFSASMLSGVELRDIEIDL